MSRRGFTAVEVLVVIAILVLLASASFLSFRSITGKDTLEQASQSALSAIARARFDALNGRAGSAYGAYLASSSVTIFSGPSYTAGAAGNVIAELGNVVIDQVALSGGGYSIPFSMLAGTTTKSGTFRMVGPTGSTKLFTIYKTGVAEVQ